MRSNASVLWCVATRTRTRRPSKVLLFGVFLPVLVTCLGTIPVITEVWTALHTCDPERISKTTVGTTLVVIIILGQIELLAIADTAVVRLVTVWAPHRPQLGMQGAVVLLVATFIYSILAGLVFLKLTKIRLVFDPPTITFLTIFMFVNFTLPAFVTAAAYIIMIIVIQRNKRSLEASQQQARVTTMDPATRAMLAVFISNMAFHMPHSIYHLMGTQPYYTQVIIHVIFYTHYIVDPLVYMWFNIGYREKILSSMRKVMQSLSLLSTTVTQTGPAASPDHLNHQNSPTHTQDDNNL